MNSEEAQERDRSNRHTASLEHQLYAALQRLKTLEQNAKDSSTESKALQVECLSELSIALEELHVATEEITLQNNDLFSARQSLELEHRRYQELFEFAPDGYLVTSPQGVIQTANKTAENLLNLRRDRIVGKPFIVFVATADRSDFYLQLTQLKTSQHLTDWEVSLKPRAHNAFPASISISAIHDLAGTWVGLRWLIRDMSESKQAKKMRYDAFHDSLTGLSNRALLLDRLGHLLDRYQRYPQQLFALLFLDLDRFKLINDSLGHLTGDEVLIEIASRLKTCVRREDTLARLGGDEFVILLEEIGDLSEAKVCAVRIQEALALPLTLSEHHIVVHSSIGIVLSGPRYHHAAELLRDADLAMYQAKHQGGASFQVFASQMHTSTLSSFCLEQELYQALQQQEFEAYYQPIMSLSTQTLIGFEALVRWRHPQHGLLTPSEFLPLAEEIGLIIAIDFWMLRTACQQMMVWQAEFELMPPLSVSVNLSSRSFSQSTLVDQVQAILDATGFDPRFLKLEITEGVIMTHVDRATTTLNQLRALQIQLMIDDFGTGYSSLSRLQHLPFHGLKIDRTFLREAKSIEVVKTIILLAHALGLYVIAEGVETADQALMLHEISCEYAQGYYFGYPTEHNLAQQTIGSQNADLKIRD